MISSFGQTRGFKVLVVEDDLTTRMLLVLSLENSLTLTTLEAGSVDQAIKLFDEHPDIRCVVTGADLTGQDSYELYKFAARRRKVPFILVSEDNQEKIRNFPEQDVSGFLKKPFFPSHVADLVSNALRKTGTAPEKHETPDYFRVRVSTMIEFGAVSSDLYLKLSESKYVRVIREGDCFTSEDAFRFSSKNIEFLHINRADCETLMQRLREDLIRETASKTLSAQTSYEVSAQTLEVIHEVARKLKMPPELETLIWASVEHAVAAIRKNPMLFRLYKNLQTNPDSYIIDHSVLLAHVACGVSALQPWVSKTTYTQMTMAAFLHDLTLTNPEVATIQKFEDYLKSYGDFSEDDKNAFICHPEEAAALVRQISAMPPDVDTIIVQHHERPDGTGFPNHLTGERIRPVVCVFIVSHEIIKYLLDGGRPEDLPKFLTELSLSYAKSKGHFRAVVQSVLTTLSR